MGGKKKYIPPILGIFVSAIALIGSVVALTMAWFTAPGGKTDKETLDGEVGLRGYFYAGNGTEDNPFEIVSPIHFYNLTRLQNLGVFSLEKTYFSIGHDFNGTYGCLNDNGEVVQYLDMGDFSNSTMILPIGGEGAPFIGNFDGHGIPIKNLTVKGYPEDIGVFGYISYGGLVTGLVCEDLTIESLGYTTDLSDYSNQLFGQQIDDIFNSSSFLTTDTRLWFYDENSSNPPHDLKGYNGTGGVPVARINDSSRTLANNSLVYNGYFLPEFPERENEVFTYSWKSSSSILKQCTPSHKTDGLDISDNNIDKAIVVDMTALAESLANENGNGFNEPDKNMQVDARLSLIASVEIGGFTYSRVIQSYKIEFFSNGSNSYTDDTDGHDYSMSIYCDYLETNRLEDKATNYHHGNNVGFLAGHVDGTITNSFVYLGQLKFNNPSYTEIKTESETGLVGEVGTNVVNSLDPDYGATSHGDTGIINYTKIYNNIRSDVTAGDTIKAGYIGNYVGNQGNKAYISYGTYKGPKYNLFKDYVRHMADAENTPITSIDNGTYEQEHLENYDGSQGGTLGWHDYDIPSSGLSSYNTVDFLWNAVVEDEDDADRGLGVFKIVSTYLDTSTEGFMYGEHIFDDIGQCRIENGSEKQKIYFSTAEYDHTANNNGASFNPLRATTLPSYSDEDSFRYPFSRDFNYCFELDLDQNRYSDGKNFMYNTKSKFLENYLYSKLIDKWGGKITPKTARFGFMFRSSENDLITSLSSYMVIGTPGSKQNFGTEENPRYYPTKSIVFRIDNKNGANVSVVGNSADITIYGYDPNVSSGGVTALYTMKSSNVGNDQHRYFKYTLSNGDTSGDTTSEVEVNNQMGDNNALYGHIFKLPQGDYVIGSGGNAKLYYLAVQGQTDASIGENEVASIGSAITSVDFLLEPPTYADYQEYIANPETSDALKVAKFSFRSNQNMSQNRTITVGVEEDEDHNKYPIIEFENNPIFINYLLLTTRNLLPGVKYYCNETAYSDAGSKTVINIQENE